MYKWAHLCLGGPSRPDMSHPSWILSFPEVRPTNLADGRVWFPHVSRDGWPVISMDKMWRCSLELVLSLLAAPNPGSVIQDFFLSLEELGEQGRSSILYVK